LISASTLFILFAADEGLRKGVFQLEDIQKDLKHKREQLKTAETVQTQVETQLSSAKKAQAKAQQELQQTNQSLQAVNSRQRATQAQLNRTISQEAKTSAQLQGTQSRLGDVVFQYEKSLSELHNLYSQRQILRSAVLQLQAQRERLYTEAKKALDQAQTAIKTRDRELANRQIGIEHRDAKIAQLDQLIQNRNLEIKQREQAIALREFRLRDLEKQQDYLEKEVARLEKYYQSYRVLRLGKLAIVRNQVLAANVVRVNDPKAARQAVIKILTEANSTAIGELTEPGAQPYHGDILRVTSEAIEKLANQIDDGREYVVRIFSAGNYVREDKQIEFFADVSRNQLVFSSGQVLAVTSADMRNMTFYQLRQRLDLLISASQFRARNAGIVENVEIDGAFLQFFTQLQQSGQPLEIKAVAAEDIYTAGPLRVKLVAVLKGQVVFST
jgi:uncharacterized protein (DUF3084 family)